ncbi:MAG: alpha/beta hydrolase [Myxococcota bacterium]
MPEKYVRDGALPILLRHTGVSTLPQEPPVGASGRAVVCLHDAGLQSSVFIDLLAALAAERRSRRGALATASSGSDGACSLAFDLPGHGRSGGLDALPSIEAMTDCARRVTGWCRASRPLLLGHGMGALVALDWAARAPEAVAGLVLCGTSGGFGVRDEALAHMREVTRGRAPRPFDPRRLAPGCDPGRMRRAWFETIQTDPRATLVDLEASRTFAQAFDARRERPTAAPALPILVVAGEFEPEADRVSARALADRLGARFVTIEQAAHWLPLEQPAVLAREVLGLAEAA